MAVTITQVPLKTPYGKLIQKVTFDWTSDGAGAASQAVTLYGYLVRVTTLPGSPAPTSYGVTLIDSDGSACDALMGLVLTRSATLTETKYTTATGSSVPLLLAGSYTFTIASAGASKAGTAHFYLVDEL